ncbi:MAG: formylglycine-generating enzyme family protein, partial [Spirochaetaceae bacterium]|jgi:formylglycine-generating enzyme required for sulfatase activity|nr:formylglycine-generating enzyme family protein [Spirochaetaceae bacterium]
MKHTQASRQDRNIFALTLAALTAYGALFTACPTINDTDGGGDGGTTNPTAINIAAIPGVTAPAPGGTPVTVINQTAQYTGTVAWNRGETPLTGAFARATVYTAVITLRALEGYTMDGVAENFFTVEGATATNPANSGVVTAVFPQTSNDTTVTIRAVPGVTAPAIGGTPVTSITQTDQYTGTVRWNRGGTPLTGNFAGVTVYTAVITLTAKEGYTLDGVAANSFTVAGAASVTNAANSGVVTAVFPQTALVIEMVNIPGGNFLMGSPEGTLDSAPNERPVHQVTLTAFKMGKYEITQGQWNAVMGNNPSYITTNPEDGGTEGWKTLPAANINWYDALVFCNTLSLLEGLTPAYRIDGKTNPADWGAVPNYDNDAADVAWDEVEMVSGSTGYRLPTEAQWEYAARGGNGSPGGYTYAGSNDVNAVGWYIGNSDGKPHQVGEKAANGLGLYDMSGNIIEWCWDWYGNYSSAAQTDPVGPETPDDPDDPIRVIRGGNWATNAQNLRSALHNFGGLDTRRDNQGLRLVRP